MFIVLFNKGTATALAVADTLQPSVRTQISCVSFGEFF